MNLRIVLADGRTEWVPVQEGNTPETELAAFLRRQTVYTGEWVCLASGEHVRYDTIVSVRLPSTVQANGA